MVFASMEPADAPLSGPVVIAACAPAPATAMITEFAKMESACVRQVIQESNVRLVFAPTIAQETVFALST